jgi:hypothetical protein
MIYFCFVQLVENNMRNDMTTDEYGTQEWWVNGQRHRVDGPAVIYADGSKRWYINDQLHRLDGPAIIRVDGSQYWYINGTHATDDVNQWMTKLDITYPFSEEHHALFLLTFGGK